MKIEYLTGSSLFVLYPDILKTKKLSDDLKCILLKDIQYNLEFEMENGITKDLTDYQCEENMKLFERDLTCQKSITAYVEKYNITNDISSLSNDAIEEYIDSLIEDYNENIEYIYNVFGDIISDLVVIDLFIEHNEKDLMHIYIKNLLRSKYATEYVCANMEYGIEFESKNERFDYISKCVNVFNKDQIEKITLEFIKYKFHILCLFTYVYESEYVKEIIHDYCTDSILFDILDDPNMKILHGYIQNMGFDTY